jgi:TatD DNase family protein
MLVDSHCHLTDDQYEDDRRDVLRRAREAGVGRVLSVCSDATDLERVGELLAASREWPEAPDVWGTAGVHPHEAAEARDGDMDRVRRLAANDPRIVAVGETGLDFFYDNSPRKTQEELFRGHLETARDLGLPVVVHSRSADDLTSAILREWGDAVEGVLHCFTGGDDLLRTALAAGWMISFTGLVTFKSYDGGELVRRVPRERLMVETDGPYLAPVPHRGKRNEPAFVARVAEAVAEIRGESLGEVEEYTTENAVRFFRMGEP